MNPADLIEFFKLSRRRLESVPRYQAFQAFQARLVVGYLVRNGVTLRDRLVVDLGAGYGGYSHVLAGHGAHVLAVDSTFDRAVIPTETIHPILADATRLPFTDQSVDFVFCTSMIEHVRDQDAVIDELMRVLRPGGYTYLSFPPFGSLRGGHQFSPFHLVGEQFAIGIYRWRQQIPRDQGPYSYADAFGTYGLVPTSIGDISDVLSKRNLLVRDVSVRFLDVRIPRIAPLSFLTDLVTWHVQFLIQKAEPPAGPRTSGYLLDEAGYTRLAPANRRNSTGVDRRLPQPRDRTDDAPIDGRPMNRAAVRYRQQNPRLADESSRIEKADKVLAVLREQIGPELSRLTCVDLGCGSGIVAARLAVEFGRVFACDIDSDAIAFARAQRGAGRLAFLIADATVIPLADASCDVVVCLHVYEHVASDEALIAEIYRILRPGGSCFLAGPNRLRLREPHLRVWALHWLPRRLTNAILRARGGQPYYERLRTPWGMRRLLRRFQVEDLNVALVRDPVVYHTTDEPGIRFGRYIPAVLLRPLLGVFSPSFNFLITKKGARCAA